jgi:hypothetical protein
MGSVFHLPSELKCSDRERDLDSFLSIMFVQSLDKLVFEQELVSELARA